MAPVRRPLASVLAAAVTGAALYLPSAGFGFVWDDRSLIQDNRYVHDARELRANLTGDYFRRSETPERIGHWRPAVTATFMGDWAAGGGRPAAFHLDNVLLYAAACGLVAALAAAIGLGAGGALAAGLLFAVHPAHVESVAWISGRTDLLCGVFVLLALCCDARGARWAAGAATLGALLAKEMGLVAPAAVAMRAAILPRPPESPRRALAPHLIAVAAYAVTRLGVLGLTPKPPEAGSHGRLALFLTWWSAFLDYARVVVAPVRLCIVPGVALETSPFAPRVLAGLALFGLVAAAAWRLRRRAPRASWGLACFLASLLPLTNFIVPIRAPAGVAFPWAERFLFVPTIFLAVAAAAALTRARRWVVALAAVAAVALAARTLAREGVWRDQRALFEATVRDAETDAGAHVDLGAALMDAGDLDGAEVHLRRALTLAPDDAIAHFDLGNLLRGRGDLEGAAAAYARALAANPGYPQASNNLGLVELARGRLAEAEAAFREADRAMGGYVAAKINLANLLRGTGRPSEAIPVFEAALALDPDSAPARAGLAAARRESAAQP